MLNDGSAGIVHAVLEFAEIGNEAHLQTKTLGSLEDLAFRRLQNCFQGKVKTKRDPAELPRKMQSI